MSFKLRSPDVAAPPAASGDLGALPEWRLQDLYEGMDSQRFAADFERAERRSQGLRRSLSRQAGGAGRPAGRRRDAGRSRQGLRVAAGFDRPHHGLCVAALRFRHQRSANREIPRGRAGACDGARGRSFVLRARAQSARRLQAGRRDGRASAQPLSPMARGHPQGEAASACRRPRTIVPGQIGQRRGLLEPIVRRHDGGAEVRF